MAITVTRSAFDDKSVTLEVLVDTAGNHALSNADLLANASPADLGSAPYADFLGATHARIPGVGFRVSGVASPFPSCRLDGSGKMTITLLNAKAGSCSIRISKA